MAHRLAPQAHSDLDEIWNYVAREASSVGIADNLVDSIMNRILLLASFPHLGRGRDDLRSGLRSYPAGQYVIIYRIEREDALILRVLHGRRDIDELLGG
ncbi:MAG: type II toxin-antitoxin system RelE/ParE family toxin [Rhizomicrobium sp.]|jgi:toxin ParE1/3/4